MSRVSSPVWLASLAISVGLAFVAAPALAQHAEAGDEKARAAAGAAGDSAHGNEHAGGGGHAAGDHGGGHGDPSRHFNYFGYEPGHLFDYRGKDAFGGPFGDGKMVDTHSGAVVQGEEPASPPYVFMLLNFALLLGLLAWKGKPVANQVAAERHDLIKTALDEAAKLRKQAADKLAEYETRLKDADAQIKQLVDGMRADAENERKRIVATAEAQAQAMQRDAEQRIAAEIETARAQLTREVTAAASAATEKLLRDKLTAGDQQKLVASFITDVQAVRTASVAGKGDLR